MLKVIDYRKDYDDHVDYKYFGDHDSRSDIWCMLVMMAIHDFEQDFDNSFDYESNLKLNAKLN